MFSSWILREKISRSYQLISKLLNYSNSAVRYNYHFNNFNHIYVKRSYFTKKFTTNMNIPIFLKNQNRKIYTSVILRSSDIPDYLKGIVNEVLDANESREDIVGDLEELVTNMEEDIIDYFLSRAIIFEELETSFIVSCPSCGKSEKSRDMYIDKNSGYCVCPWCYLDGEWDEIMKIFDSQDHFLNKQHLEDFFFKLKPINEEHLDTLLDSSFKNADISQLKDVSAKMSDDQTKIVFPLQGLGDETTGFASFSLLSKNPKTILRVLEGECGFFSPIPLSKTKKIKRLVIVSSVSDALALAKLKIPALVLYSDPKPEVMEDLFKNYRSIVLWCNPQDIRNNLLQYLISRSITTFIVKSTSEFGRISLLPARKVSKFLMDALPVSFTSLIDFCEIRDSIYDRIINKDQIFGVKWTRYTELNNILLGHRKGELTIFSGQTGSGKTTLMSEYSLDLCMQGVRTLWGSFEIGVTRLCEVMLQQYSGKNLPNNYSKFREIVDEFSHLPMHFLNVHGPQPLKNVIDMMTEAVLLKGVTHIVIDNLQFMLGIHGASSNWWLEQDGAVSAFRYFATTYNCHVTLIVHPKKLATGEKLNLQSISGGARVTQEADNVMFLHLKENRDGSTNVLGSKTLQVVKNRFGGTLGELRLRFHKESLTFSSCFRSTKEGKRESYLEIDESGDQNTKTIDIKDQNSKTIDIKDIPFFEET